MTLLETEEEQHANILKHCLLNYVWSPSSQTPSGDLNLIKAGILIRSASITCRMRRTNFTDIMAGVSSILDIDDFPLESLENYVTSQNGFSQTTPPKSVWREQSDLGCNKFGAISNPANRECDDERENKNGTDTYEPFGRENAPKWNIMQDWCNSHQDLERETLTDTNGNLLLLLKDASLFYERLTQLYRNYLTPLKYENYPHKSRRSKAVIGDWPYIPFLPLITFDDVLNHIKLTEDTSQAEDNGISLLLKQLDIMVDTTRGISPPTFEESQTTLPSISFEEQDNGNGHQGAQDMLTDFVDFYADLMPLWSLPDEDIIELPTEFQSDNASEESSLSLSFSSSDLNLDQSTDLRPISMDISNGDTEDEPELLELLDIGADLENASAIRTSTPAEDSISNFSQQMPIFDSPQLKQRSDGNIYPNLNTQRFCPSRRRLWEDSDIKKIEDLGGVSPLSKKSSSEPDLQGLNPQENMQHQEPNSISNHLNPFMLFPNMQFSKAPNGPPSQTFGGHPTSILAVGRPNQVVQNNRAQAFGAPGKLRQPPQITGQSHIRTLGPGPFQSYPQSAFNPFNDLQRGYQNAQSINSINNVRDMPHGPLDLVSKLMQHPQTLVHAQRQAQQDISTGFGTFFPQLNQNNQFHFGAIRQWNGAIAGGYPSRFPAGQGHQGASVWSNQHNIPTPVPPQNIPFGFHAKFSDNNPIPNRLPFTTHQPATHRWHINPRNAGDTQNGFRHSLLGFPPTLSNANSFPKLDVTQQGQDPQSHVRDRHFLSQQNLAQVPPWRNANLLKDNRFFVPSLGHAHPGSTSVMPPWDHKEAKPIPPLSQLIYQKHGQNGQLPCSDPRNSLLNAAWGSKVQSQPMSQAPLHVQARSGVNHIFSEHQLEHLRDLTRKFPDVSDVKIANDFQAMLKAMNEQQK